MRCQLLSCRLYVSRSEWQCCGYICRAMRQSAQCAVALDARLRGERHSNVLDLKSPALLPVIARTVCSNLTVFAGDVPKASIDALYPEASGSRWIGSHAVQYDAIIAEKITNIIEQSLAIGYSWHAGVAAHPISARYLRLTEDGCCLKSSRSSL